MNGAVLVHPSSFILHPSKGGVNGQAHADLAENRPEGSGGVHRPAVAGRDAAAGRVAAAAPTTAPLRMAFLYVPNGVNMAEWKPKEEGAGYALTPSLQPLQAFKDDYMVLTGLTADKARPHGDGGGDHARAMASFLTGRQARKTDGADIRVGISVDQLAAEKVGQATRFASLEIGCEGGKNAGNCDSGYSCAYSSNISWRGEATPMSKEVNPKLVFDRLFSTAPKGDGNAARRERDKQSILDFVADDAKSLQATLGANDQRKVDEYLTGVRELELRIAKAPPAVDLARTRWTGRRECRRTTRNTIG